ncbi:MAG: DegT/DnrJ/EryC1/StrS family aminotransferase [Synechococcales cyanobacterium T60_A2020_003]|nr:DegT/DnrJ/EryC1/StrS family aminotransferase [Synechococcales cyanobacterium T60_A2020_003]
MTSIPPFELTHQYQTLASDIEAAVAQVLASGQYINGAIVDRFETEFAAYIGTRDCVTCNSGTDALYLALRALDIGSGDEVITTPFTFFATTETITAAGATPVFIDIDPATFNLDLNQIEAAITPRTKAILPVNLFGQPVDMTRLMAIARAHNLAVIEDCAQSTGAMWGKQKVGSIGHIGCFSFFPTKNLGACGDAGAITTNDPVLAEKVRTLKNHGQRQRYIYEEIGINSRLDAVQAAILLIKLRHLDTWNAQRQAIADRYTQGLKDVTGIVTPGAIAGGTSVWNQYTIRVLLDSSFNGHNSDDLLPRDRVRQALQDQGISSMIYYPLALHLQPVYANLGYQPGQLPHAEQAAQEVMSLPMFPELTQESQNRVITAVAAVVQSASSALITAS